MSKRVVELFVVDLLVAMDKISRYKAGFNDAQSFYHDEKSFDATIRELQIVGEATKHLISSNILGKEYRVIVDFKETVYILLKDFNKEILLKIIANTKEDSRGKTADFLQDL
jgi:uncharacterized protein with HEPN domain